MRPVHGPSKSEQKHRRQPENPHRFERGFIKAEVVNYQDLLDCGSYAGAREKGLVRMKERLHVATAMSSCSVSTFDK